jgi:hypothetical protein
MRGRGHHNRGERRSGAEGGLQHKERRLVAGAELFGTATHVALRSHMILYNSSLLRFCGTKQVSTIPTSVRRHRRQPEAEPKLAQ